MKTAFALLGLAFFAVRGQATDFQPESHDGQVMEQFIGLLTVYPLLKTTLGDFDPAFAVEKEEGLTWAEAVAEANRRFGERQPQRTLFLRKYLNKDSPVSHVWALDWDRVRSTMTTWMIGGPTSYVSHVSLAWSGPGEPTFNPAFQAGVPKGIPASLDLKSHNEPLAWYGLDERKVHTALKMISPEAISTSLNLTSPSEPWPWYGLGEPMVHTAFKMTSPEGNTTSLDVTSPSEPLLRITATVANNQLGSEPVLELVRGKQTFKFDASDHLISITSSLVGGPLETQVQISCSGNRQYSAQITGPGGEFEMLFYTPDLLLRERTISIPDGEHFHEYFEQGRLRKRVHYGTRKVEHGTQSFIEREETFP